MNAICGVVVNLNAATGSWKNTQKWGSPSHGSPPHVLGLKTKTFLKNALTMEIMISRPSTYNGDGQMDTMVTHKQHSKHAAEMLRVVAMMTRYYSKDLKGYNGNQMGD